MNTPEQEQPKTYTVLCYHTEVAPQKSSKYSDLEHIDNQSPLYKSVDGVLFTADGKRLVWYPAKKQGTHYTVPDGVHAIGDRAFKECAYLQEVQFPDSLTEIGEEAFRECKVLRKITLPNSVVRIGAESFRWCRGLKRVKLSRSLAVVPRKAFDGCGFKQIVVSASVTIISEEAFYGCSSLTSIKLPDTLTTIGPRAFDSCGSLKNIKLPRSLVNFWVNALPMRFCFGLEAIESDSPHFKSIDGVLFNADGTELICYPKGRPDENYTIPEGVTEIVPHAFDDTKVREIDSNSPHFVLVDGVLFDAQRKRLINYSPKRPDEHYTIPDSVEQVDHGAFHRPAQKPGLSSLTLSKQIQRAGFLRHNYLNRIECDSPYYKSIDGVLFSADGKSLVAYPGRSKKRRYELPEGVTEIDPFAFPDCDVLSTLVLPASVRCTCLSDGLRLLNLKKIIVPKEHLDRFKDELWHKEECITTQ